MSSNEYENDDDLLGVLQPPPYTVIPEQVAHWDHGNKSPTYKLQRKPSNLEEFNRYKHGIAIWRDNETLAYITPRGSGDAPATNQICLVLIYEHCGRGPTLCITGNTVKAVAETADFFHEFGGPEIANSYLAVGPFRSKHYDFRDAPFQCLPHLLDPSRALTLVGLKLSAVQSVFLATRSHPIRLTLCACTIEDEGTAFIEALENRKSSFGTLVFEDRKLPSEDHLKRLLQNDRIDRLGLPRLNDELVLLPFPAKVDHLVYEISSSSLLRADLQTVNIVPNKLSFLIHHSEFEFPTDAILALLRRLADLGHFVELKIGLNFYGERLPNCVVQEVIRVTLANTELKVLDLRNNDVDVDWRPHVTTLLQGIKGHKGLRKLKLNVHESAYGFQYCHLRQFLSEKRNIVVTDKDDITHSHHPLVDHLYTLNRFYLGSAALVTEPLPQRSLLVTTSMIESAINSPQRFALLLSDHVDVLPELVQSAQLDERFEDATLHRPLTATFHSVQGNRCNFLLRKECRQST